jgi:hypothetical protein
MSLCDITQSDEFMLLCEFIQSDEFTLLCEFIQSDKFTLLCEFIQSMNSRHYMRIHTSYEFMLCWRNSLVVGAIIFFTFGAVKVAEQFCLSLNLYCCCALRYARNICLLFSCAVGSSIV